MYHGVARYGAMQKVEPVQAEIADLRPLEKVVLKTDRGTELGAMLSSSTPLPEGAPPPVGPRVVRRATEDDLGRQAELAGSGRQTSEQACAEMIAQQKLPMSLVCAEHLLGEERICFYFMSEERVDFRNLIRDLSRALQTRIELRQIGPREAARLLGDCQSCGQPLCCRSFLRRLEPIPMSLARLQKQSLDPSKISGQCGKLKCCLRFEEQVYSELRQKLPTRGTTVLVEGVRGQVVQCDVYNQRVTVSTAEGTQITVPAGKTQVVPEKQ
jgi:cell fate regulator YaaT (PSP1 superfamily)